jgi:hypothetical protein
MSRRTAASPLQELTSRKQTLATASLGVERTVLGRLAYWCRLVEATGVIDQINPASKLRRLETGIVPTTAPSFRQRNLG